MRGSQEWTSLLEQENERLAAIVKAKDEEIALLQEYGEDADELRDEVARLKMKTLEASQQAVHNKQDNKFVARSRRHRRRFWRSLDQLPDSMLELVGLAGKVYPDRIVFTEKALESAKVATFADIPAISPGNAFDQSQLSCTIFTSSRLFRFETSYNDSETQPDLSWRLANLRRQETTSDWEQCARISQR